LWFELGKIQYAGGSPGTKPSDGGFITAGSFLPVFANTVSGPKRDKLILQGKFVAPTTAHSIKIPCKSRMFAAYEEGAFQWKN
jgi:hypothetical protein